MPTPHNAPNTLKIPLQSTNKSGKTIFAYMRRSTTKIEQEDSLPQQEEGIEYIAKELWIDYSTIIPFTESKSGFENRTRKEWWKMLEAIDQSKEPCIILCRDTSRLSRNPTDNLEIANRMFGDNKFKKSIGSIYFLWENFDVNEWSDRTNKIYIVDTLHKNYTDSMETKEKSMAGILLKLLAWEFPYTPPHGLVRVGKDWDKRKSKTEKTTLRTNNKMPFILKAFQMKVEWKVAKEISQYLKKYGWFFISPKKIVETIIQNTVYKGEYTEVTTNRFFDGLKFWEGKPPIDKTLWDTANKTIWKRGNGHGEWQKENHLLIWQIKSENDTTFQVYIAKGKSGNGKHYNYKGLSKDKNGKTVSIYIAETDILNFVTKEIKQIIDKIIEKIATIETDRSLREPVRESIKNYIKSLPNMPFSDTELEENIEKLVVYFEDYNDKKSILATSPDAQLTEKYVSYDMEILSSFFNENKSREYTDNQKIIAELWMTKDIIDTISDEQFWHTEELQELLQTKIRLRDSIIFDALKDSSYFQRLQEEFDFQKTAVEQFQKQKEDIAKDMAWVQDKAFAMGYDKAFADRQIESKRWEIARIELSIRELENNTNLQDILDKIPVILSKIVELTDSPLWEAKTKDSREHIKIILEIITVELTIGNKKELKIKLFEGLEDFLNDEKWNWSHHRDLNPRPLHYQWSALPLSYGGI